jgi:hypothetical protein
MKVDRLANIKPELALATLSRLMILVYRLGLSGHGIATQAAFRKAYA